MGKETGTGLTPENSGASELACRITDAVVFEMEGFWPIVQYQSWSDRKIRQFYKKVALAVDEQLKAEVNRLADAKSADRSRRSWVDSLSE